jgi:hypothetical protein
MSTLEEIGFAHGTDKSKLCHDYLNTYEQFFAPLRDQPITLLELGVQHGYSLRTWRDYFTAATIVGVDHLPLMTDTLPKTFLYQCDQADPRLPVMLGERRFDIIIDDCSHRSANTIASFTLLWPLLKGGGLYIIEDMAAHDNLDALHFVAGLADSWRPAGHVTVPQMIEHYAANHCEYAWIRLSARLAIIAKAD